MYFEVRTSDGRVFDKMDLWVGGFSTRQLWNVSGSLCRFLRVSWMWCAALWKWFALKVPALNVVSKVRPRSTC